MMKNSIGKKWTKSNLDYGLPCFHLLLVFINRERKEDIFSEAFRSILDSITPSILTGFDSSTIQLLLEICYSYLADKEIQHQ